MALAHSSEATVIPPRQVAPSWNPLKCVGTDLPVNLTVMVKVLAIALLFTNHVRILPDPWLPFIPFVDLIPPEVFQRTIQIVFIISTLSILFNRRVRLSALVLGSTMLLAVVSSKAYYGNNKTFCGLMLLLAGLYKPGAPPFIRWQLAITYFGAGLNKLLDPDWQTGIFFENWAVHRLRQPWYIAVDSILPPMLLARFMCWTTIVTELGVVPCILIPSLAYWAIVCNVLFQSSLLLFTGTTFTLFFYSMCAASFGFVTWPDSAVRVTYNPHSAIANRARRMLESWDVDRRFQWQPIDASSGPRRYVEGNPTPNWIQLHTTDKVIGGFSALRMIVLLNPITYFVITAAIASLEEVSGPTVLFRRLIVGTCLVLLMPPLVWLADQYSQVRPNVNFQSLGSSSGD
jgi:hypothetical protein